MKLGCAASNFLKNVKRFGLRYSLELSVRHYGYEASGKTTVTILNKELSLGLMVDSFSQLGFRLNNGMSVLGPMAIFPRSVLSWNVESSRDINEDSLSLFFVLEPKIDILVLGIGDEGNNFRLWEDLYRTIHRHKINVEILPTEQACSTFNFLNVEGRCVAAGLIPPVTLRHSDDDVLLTKLNQKRLFELNVIDDK
ncbi:NADH dehydrogenase [ubiquinone] 1 alpha subcomplex assembly factor 3 isoform X1 [Bacillus rossius redtenbacheri]